MATKKKLLQAAAGTAAASGGAGLNVEEVFSTYLYTGNGSTQTITNGIDLSGEGGLVWHKARGQAFDHYLVDTERGGTKAIRSNLTNSEVVYSSNPFIQSFNANGFTQGQGNAGTNGSGYDYASWTFRKAPKFFDVVTYTGDGTEPSAWINHNLGTTPASIWIKRTDSTSNWFVYHKDLSGRYNSLYLNDTSAEQTTFVFDNTTNGITDTQFRVWFGGSNLANISGATYVAYLFAHNDGDGDFGPTGDQDIIKCGSYTGTGSEMFIDLGFEPQWILTRRTDTTDNWFMVDTMRGIVSGGGEDYLWANTSNAEQATTAGWAVNPTGFTVESASRYASGGNYIYIAIRRGPMAVPTAATDVFAIQDGRAATDGTASANAYTSGFPVDLLIQNNKNGGSHPVIDRLRSGAVYLKTDATDAEVSWNMRFDDMDGVWRDATASAASYFMAYMWKRAPSFFDVVAFTSATSGATTVDHNLGVAPDMIWVKRRDSGTANWRVYHSGLSDPNNQLLRLNGTNAVATSTGKWSTSDTTFSINDDNSSPFIAYLFASLDGVSKVGSYTGTGAGGNQIDCGFSSGARFVLIKAASSAGSWNVFDTERGIVAGNDARLKLNNTNAEDSTTDIIDPYNSGFELANDAGDTNSSGVTYIFYAIA